MHLLNNNCWRCASILLTTVVCIYLLKPSKLVWTRNQNQWNCWSCAWKFSLLCNFKILIIANICCRRKCSLIWYDPKQNSTAFLTNVSSTFLVFYFFLYNYIAMLVHFRHVVLFQVIPCPVSDKTRVQENVYSNDIC